MESKYKTLSALVYDFNYPINQEIDGDITFYKPHLLPLENRILELGTGNGRFLIPFLRYGLKMEALDNSPEMLDLLNQNLIDYNLKTTIHNFDVLKMNFHQEFETILFTNGFLNLLITQENIYQVLKNSYNALIKDGFVMIDLIYPNIDFKQDQQIQNVFQIHCQEITVTNTFAEINYQNQTTTNIIEYKSEKITEIQNFELTWIEQEQILEILKQIGFSKITFFKRSRHTIIVKAYK
ncbi:class I SAM-dependent methyltransferase [Williamsoniiplasma luminosum]|uniref:Methyltransferase domain-containing protein n=1 Tax=Williamsoniiplasma luminosum TaxID=214888 RepID=A0A2S0NL39_9MOLU|nr:class I SAM-dependent methyltransferase [Williamsoniiplasma luminosum]AVP49726.1 MAG: hypothetical protein C5T88_04095 [Williamsoniiplasma luminosum]